MRTYLLKEDNTKYEIPIKPEPLVNTVNLEECDASHGFNPLYNDAVKKGMFKGWKHAWVHIWIVLKSFEGENCTCFPSCKTIADIVGTSRGRINIHIHEMVKAGIIEILDKGDAERSATYRILTYSRVQRPKSKSK